MEKCDKNALVVWNYWEQCWNLHNPDALDNTHVITFAQNGVPIGVENFKEGLRSFFLSFPDIKVSVEDIMIVDDRVLTRVVYRATHLGIYENIPATNKEICVGALELFLVIGGKIVQHWHEMDHLAILNQIND